MHTILYIGVGQASHITLPLSTKQGWVPGGTRKLNCIDWLAIAVANAEISPLEMRLHKREFQYQERKLSSLLNSMLNSDYKQARLCLVLRLTYIQTCSFGLMIPMITLLKTKLTSGDCLFDLTTCVSVSYVINLEC